MVLALHWSGRTPSGQHNRLTVHYTPERESWLDLAEIELDLYERQSLGTPRCTDLGLPKEETRAGNRQTDL
jgi:hypothetical protein